MTTEAITPLCQRMIEDMNAQKLCAGTQSGHIKSLRRALPQRIRCPTKNHIRFIHWVGSKAEMLVTWPLCDDNVIHCQVAREPPTVGEDFVDNAGFLDEAQSTALYQGFELNRCDKFSPSMGSSRHPSQDVLGGDDPKREALQGTIESCEKHQPARLHGGCGKLDEQAHIRDVLDDFHGKNHVKSFTDSC
jgi:hypothetical protein